VANKKALSAEDHALLKKFRVTPKVVAAAKLRRLDNKQARLELGLGTSVMSNDIGGLGFTGWDLAGEERGILTVRQDDPDAEAKYMSRKGSDGRYLGTLPGAPAKLKSGAKVMLVESFKSVLAITSAAERSSQNIVVVSTNGCNGWLQKQDDAESEALPDLDLLAGHDVVICLDSNVATKADVKKAELRLALHLTTKVTAKSIRCGRVPLEDQVNGPDDYLAEHTDKQFWSIVAEAREPWLVGNTFATYDALVNAKEPEFLIEDVLQDQGICGIGGLSGHGKTWILLSITKALLTGKKLFGYFAVKRTVPRVLYLTPEVQLGQLKLRLKKFGLMEFVQSGRLLVRTLSEGPAPTLLEPDILMAACGAVTFLDTAVRFMSGKESAAEDNRDGLAVKCFSLLQAGAVSVIFNHHSPKGFQKEDYMTLENVFRGSSDIGAQLSGAWGVRQIDAEKNIVHIENLKPRDQDPFSPFQIVGRPCIDRDGDFCMARNPGQCGPLSEYVKKSQGGRPADDGKNEKFVFIREQLAAGVESSLKITEELNKKFDSKHGDRTVRGWIQVIKKPMDIKGQVKS
jgi:hypothetical protein